MVWGLAQFVKFVVVRPPTESTGNRLYGFEVTGSFENSPHHIQVLRQIPCWSQVVGVLQWGETEKFLLVFGTQRI